MFRRHTLYHFLVVLLFISSDVRAQNIVPNSGFDLYTSCPTGVSQMSKCVGWQAFHSGTTDYFNICATTASQVNVPANIFGYRTSLNGDGYAGFITYQPLSTYKEYLARPIPALTAGDPYEASVFVSLAGTSSFGTSYMGMWFYKTLPVTTPGAGALPFTPQASFLASGFVLDTLNWTKLTTTFVADSAYTNMVIGDFGAYGNTPNKLTGFGNSGGAYYFIDSVVVRPRNFSFNFPDTALCAGDSIILPFFVKRASFVTSNIFSLQLSDASGSFTSPVTIATRTGDTGGVFRGIVPASTVTGRGYRLRIKSTNILDSSLLSFAISIGNIKPLKPIASANSPLCEQDTIKLFTSTGSIGAVYTWTGPLNYYTNTQNTYISPAHPGLDGRYIVAAWLDGCASRDTITINVIPTTGHITAFSNSPICENDTLRLSATMNVANITDIKWYVNVGWTPYVAKNPIAYSKDTIFTNRPSATRILSIVGRDGLCFARADINVVVKPVPPNFKIGSNKVVCEGDSLYINAPITISPLSILWKGPAGFTSTTPKLSFDPVTLDRNGHYLVVGTINGCSSRDSIDITIKPAIGLIQNTATTPICEGDTLKLSGKALAPNNLGFLWIGPGGYMSDSPDTVINHSTAAMAGRYILFGNFDNCSSSDTLDVVVRPVPVVFEATANTPLCAGDVLKLAGKADTNIHQYIWKGPSGFYSSAQDTSILKVPLSASGNYILSGYYDGCVANDTLLVQVKPVPDSVVVNISSPICEGDSLRLTGNSSAGSTYAWSGPSGFTANGRQVSRSDMQQSKAGSYIVVAELNGCTTSSTVSVVVTPYPALPIPASNSPLRTGELLKLDVSNEVTGLNYKWTGPANFTSLAASVRLQNLSLLNAGMYVITATQNGCSTSDSILVTISGDVDTTFVIVYPNANNGNFTISASTLHDQDIPINITASNGQLIYETSAKTVNKKLLTNVSLRDAVASGVYSLRVSIDGKLLTVRLVVVRQ